ncbi:hypothetical protein BJ508DRAFT_418118 [Ascobolus immersus RN42]|uniref:Uncharacterized protein n=1 Tax=Ascobolus immersus RN42 TaxID=1160509 RepID=A0A3N4HTY1_ASCIM|nr:hypothetical protein BJ508DRAFT_418118 [Ascobolus immersus RN42]
MLFLLSAIATPEELSLFSMEICRQSLQETSGHFLNKEEFDLFRSIFNCPSSHGLSSIIQQLQPTPLAPSNTLLHEMPTSLANAIGTSSAATANTCVLHTLESNGDDWEDVTISKLCVLRAVEPNGTMMAADAINRQIIKMPATARTYLEKYISNICVRKDKIFAISWIQYRAEDLSEDSDDDEEEIQKVSFVLVAVKDHYFKSGK